MLEQSKGETASQLAGVKESLARAAEEVRAVQDKKAGDLRAEKSKVSSLQNAQDKIETELKDTKRQIRYRTTVHDEQCSKHRETLDGLEKSIEDKEAENNRMEKEIK